MASVGNSYGSAPVNTVAPAVTGTATFGSTLTTTNGTWTGAPAPTFTYQWFRSPSTSISGATSSTYVLVAADVGFGIFCRVTATNSVAPSGVTADSNTTATVAAVVPGAPTIGTATQATATTATVTYTAPASNGGATITSYTATSSPGSVTGTVSQAGSGTITVSGLTANTSYTFTVTATNSVGTSSASSASNSITMAPFGQAVITGNWTAPTGVTSISFVMVGPGAPAGQSSGGGQLGYQNNYTVIPGNTYTFTGGTNSLSFNSVFNVARGGSAPSGFTGGGGGGSDNYAGGGAAGYTGNGGGAGASGSGGGGGGGGDADGTTYNGGGGGGVGLLGQGSNGAGGGGDPDTGGGGGSGGNNGTGANAGSNGGLYGGSKGIVSYPPLPFVSGTSAGGGMRIIWPGTVRQFPSTNTGNM